MRPEFESAKAVSKQRLCKHRCDADKFKSRNAGEAKNQFLNSLGYNTSRIFLIFKKGDDNNTENF